MKIHLLIITAIFYRSCSTSGFCQQSLMGAYGFKGTMKFSTNSNPICQSVKNNCCSKADISLLHDKYYTSILPALESYYGKVQLAFEKLKNLHLKTLALEFEPSGPPKKQKFCELQHDAFKSFPFERLIDDLMAGFEKSFQTFKNVHSSFGCFICDYDSQINIILDSRSVMVDSSFCLSMLNQNMLFMTAFNVNLINYFKLLESYLDCGAFDEYNFPFFYENKSTLSQNVKDCYDNFSDDALSPPCEKVCSNLLIGAISPVFEGDFLFINQACEKYSSVINIITEKKLTKSAINPTSLIQKINEDEEIKFIQLEGDQYPKDTESAFASAFTNTQTSTGSQTGTTGLNGQTQTTNNISSGSISTGVNQSGTQQSSSTTQQQGTVTGLVSTVGNQSGVQQNSLTTQQIGTGTGSVLTGGNQSGIQQNSLTTQQIGTGTGAKRNRRKAYLKKNSDIPKQRFSKANKSGKIRKTTREIKKQAHHYIVIDKKPVFKHKRHLMKKKKTVRRKNHQATIKHAKKHSHKKQRKNRRQKHHSLHHHKHKHDRLLAETNELSIPKLYSQPLNAFSRFLAEVSQSNPSTSQGVDLKNNQLDLKIYKDFYDNYKILTNSLSEEIEKSAPKSLDISTFTKTMTVGQGLNPNSFNGKTNFDFSKGDLMKILTGSKRTSDVELYFETLINSINQEFKTDWIKEMNENFQVTIPKAIAGDDEKSMSTAKPEYDPVERFDQNPAKTDDKTKEVAKPQVVVLPKSRKLSKVSLKQFLKRRGSAKKRASSWHHRNLEEMILYESGNSKYEPKMNLNI